MEKDIIKFFIDHDKKKVEFKRWFGSWDLIPIYKDNELTEVKETSIRYNIAMLPFLVIASIYFLIKGIGRKGRVRRNLKRTNDE